MLTINAIKISVEKGMKLWIYDYEFPDSTTIKKKTKKYIWKLLLQRYSRNDGILVCYNMIISIERMKMIDGFNCMVEGKEKVIEFKERRIVMGELKEDERMMNCNVIVDEVMEENEEFKKMYQKRNSLYVRKKELANNYYQSKNLRSIERFFKESVVKEAIEMIIGERENGTYLIIEPRNICNNYDPKADKLIKMFEKLKIGEKEFHHKFSEFSISSLDYRNVSKALPIFNVRFDMGPLTECDFSKDFKNYKDYVEKTYADRIKRRGIKINDVGPMIEVKSGNSSQFYIAGLTSVNCHVENDKHFNQDWFSKYTNMKLNDRFGKIKQFMKLLNDCKVSSRLKKFGININFQEKFSMVKTSSASNFQLSDCKSNVFTTVGERGFSWNPSQIKLNGNKNGFTKILVLFDNHIKNESRKVFNSFMGVTKKKGIKHDESDAIIVYYERDSVIETIKKFIYEKGIPRIIMVFSSRKNDIRGNLYNQVYAFALKRGIILQFILGRTIKRQLHSRGPQVLSKSLFLQLYGKLGQPNWYVEDINTICPSFFQKGEATLCIGIDVSRESSRTYIDGNGERKNVPNCYAIVGCCPKNNFSRRITYMLKGKGKEISCKAISEGIRYIIKEFKSVFKNMDVSNLIIFRDGVAENQFDEVRKEEVKAIKEIIGTQCKLMFLLCQKRHNIMLSMRKGNYYQNSIPSTYVNDAITFSNHLKKEYQIIFDFFINSSSNAMTTKPLHVCCLYSDYPLNEKWKSEVINLTFSMSSLLSTSIKTIKVPYVAHLAHCLSDKVYKAVIKIKGDRRKGQRLEFTLDYFNLDEKKLKKGITYEEEGEDVVEIRIHDRLKSTFFEL